MGSADVLECSRAVFESWNRIVKRVWNFGGKRRGGNMLGA